MKPTLIGLSIFAAPMAITGSDFWAKVPDNTIPRARQMTSVGSLEEEGPLKVFTDQASFDAAVGGADVLSVETFNGGATAAGATDVCSEPMNKVTNDACFANSDLIDWFSITSSSGRGMVSLGAGILGPGQTSTVIGSDTFVDSTVVTFATPVTAFSIELYNAAVAQEIGVEAFDAGDISIGAVSVTPPAMDVPVFLGVVSGRVIVRLEITATNGSRELLDNLRFGEVIGVE